MSRSLSRSAARLAAVQALYQQDMEGTPVPQLLKEFHDHRLGATIGDDVYRDAEQDFFDDIVSGANDRSDDIVSRSSMARCGKDAAVRSRQANGGKLGTRGEHV